MKPLKEALETADRNALISDVVKLIDQEVASKSGFSGLALKGGYKVIKKLKGGRMIDKAVGFLLDDFTDALEPMHKTFREGDGGGTFVSYLSAHKRDARNALLGITDNKINNAENPVIKKTYKKLRPQAESHVEDALPGVGRLIDRYTAD